MQVQVFRKICFINLIDVIVNNKKVKLWEINPVIGITFKTGRKTSLVMQRCIIESSTVNHSDQNVYMQVA